MQIVIDDEKIIDLLETEWGYVGIREDVRRLLIENGTPLSEELEEIKAEIEEKMRKNNCDLYGYADSLVSIDKHISKLKGEYR